VLVIVEEEAGQGDVQSRRPLIPWLLTVLAWQHANRGRLRVDETVGVVRQAVLAESA
jgi:hypothetical protein